MERTHKELFRYTDSGNQKEFHVTMACAQGSFSGNEFGNPSQLSRNASLMTVNLHSEDMESPVTNIIPLYNLCVESVS